MRRRVRPRLWILALVVTIAVLGVSVLIHRHQYAQGEIRLQKAIEHRNAIILEANALSRELDFAQTDEFVIRFARNNLGMVLPGEVCYVNGAR